MAYGIGNAVGRRGQCEVNNPKMGQDGSGVQLGAVFVN